MNKGTAVWTVAAIGVAPRRCRARRAAKEAGHEVRSIHSVKSLKRNILEFCGISPVRTGVMGMIKGRGHAREDWLTKMSVLGWQGG